jgi:transcriptional regulator with XRE-family HTH domain
MPKSIFSKQQEQLQNLLRQARIDASLTQSDLAKRLGQPQSFVSKYESGERALDLVELRRICNAVGVSVLDLVRKWENSLK